MRRVPRPMAIAVPVAVGALLLGASMTMAAAPRPLASVHPGAPPSSAWQTVAGDFTTTAGANARILLLRKDGLAGFTTEQDHTLKGVLVWEVEHPFPTQAAAFREMRLIQHAGIPAWIEQGTK